MAALAAAVGTVLVGGCGSGKTPQGHEQRLLKSAGVTRFRITYTKDIWEATKPYDDLTEVTVTRRKGKVYTYELTGSELVEYLRELERDAYGPEWGRGINEQEAKRMYDVISPMVDAIRPNPGPDTRVPAVTLDDAVPSAPSGKPA
ncbi:hypothetical protein [Streptomyces lasiicapitis]|uniref:hypothetical protein n=1 Tax=Streptomyces lasiicapitis TaxID=1923961 RepID=UPI001667BBC9|nr:hypothetical protein [Streptomyces lasiicapitis]